MFSSTKISALAIMTIAALTISGQTALARVEAVGMHDATCQELVALIDAGDDESIYYATAAVTWVEGYLSGANAMNSQRIDLEPQELGGDTRIQVIVGICRQNPDATLEQVAAAYYLTLIDYQETPTS